jgi:hypothetical protein
MAGTAGGGCDAKPGYLQAARADFLAGLPCGAIWTPNAPTGRISHKTAGMPLDLVSRYEFVIVSWFSADANCQYSMSDCK